VCLILYVYVYVYGNEFISPMDFDILFANGPIHTSLDRRRFENAITLIIYNTNTIIKVLPTVKASYYYVIMLLLTIYNIPDDTKPFSGVRRNRKTNVYIIIIPLTSTLSSFLYHGYRKKNTIIMSTASCMFVI